MTRKIFNYGIWGIGVVLFIIFFCPVTVFASTNINSDVTSHWAWNDFTGWMNFYSVGNVSVSLTGVVGDASSSAGILSLDCTTHSTCGASSSTYYAVVNDGAGNLSGWSWNDEYGWISFCGGQSTSNCPGSVSYSVSIGSDGSFSGYAWNNTIGWISFNCYQPVYLTNTCGTSNYKVQTSWTASSTTGYLDSQTFDTGVVGGAQINSVLWQGSMPAGASSTGVAIGFQFAVSNSSSGPWNFIGPNNIPNSTSSYWSAPTPGVSVPLDYNFYNNFRYFRYRITLFSNTAQTMSPRVNDVIVNWSP